MTLNHASLFSDFDTFLFAENTAYLFSGNRKDRKTCSDYCRLVKSAKNRFEKISQITVNEMDCEVAWVIGAFNLNNLFLWGLCIPIGMAPMWAVNVKNNGYTQAYLSLRQFRINDKEYQEAIMVEQKQY